jgi:hypothetical protein
MVKFSADRTCAKNCAKMLAAGPPRPPQRARPFHEQINLEVNLLLACERGDIAQMRDLLGQGASANYDGGRPLRKSADNGQAAAARLLLEHGADVNASFYMAGPRSTLLRWVDTTRSWALCLRPVRTST